MHPAADLPRALDRRAALALLLLLVVAAAVRVVAWQRTAVLFNDGPIFLAMAEAIGEGRWDAVRAHPFHPLYPALVALSSPVFDSLEAAAVSVSILGGLLMVVGVFAFARAAFDSTVAWLSAWTVALHPWAVDFSSDVMSDGLYGGLFLVGVALVFRLLQRPTPRLGIAVGLVTGLAYLVRPEGIGLMGVALVLLIARGLREPGCLRRARASAVALGLTTAIVMSPLLVPLVYETGELRLTRKKSVAGLASGESGLRLAAPATNARLEGQSLAPIPLPRSAERVGGSGARRPERSLRGVAEAFSRAVRTSLASLRYEVAIFAGLGLWTLRRRWRWERESLVLLLALLYTSVLILLVWGAGYVARRHALAALLPLVAYAALGWRAGHGWLVGRLLGGVPERVERGNATRAVCLGLALVLCLVWGGRDLRERRAGRVAVRAAAEWLAEQDLEGGVAAQKLRIAYYAQAPFVPLPSGRDASLESALRAAGARWVVIDEGRFDDHEGLAEGLGDWLRPIHRVEGEERTAVVLAVQPEPAH